MKLSENSWVSVSLVLAIAGSFGSAVWFAAQTDARVSTLEVNQKESASQLKELNATMVDIRILLEKNFKKK